MTKIQELVRNCVNISVGVPLLAKTLGVTERTVYRWLSGESEPMAKYLVVLYDMIIKKGHRLNR